jgi:hypothetical protein
MMRRWVQTWRKAGPELERIRLRELRDVDTQLAIQQLAADRPVKNDRTLLLLASALSQGAR